MGTIASADYLMPLSAETVPALANFSEAAVAADAMRSNQTIYAVPFASQTQFVIYNKAIFDQNGLGEPQTWDELLSLAKTLEDKGIMPFANGTATAWQNETIVGALVSSIMGKDLYSGFWWPARRTSPTRVMSRR